MPTPRESSAVTCSCGKRWGDLRRAAGHEDMELVEAELIRLAVPRMVRHWRLQHELTVNPIAPIWVKALIAKAAREMAASDETGMVRR